MVTRAKLYRSTRCSALLKLPFPVRCSWHASVERDGRLYMNRGSALLALHRSDEALGDFASALRLNPRYVEAHFNFAAAHFAQNEYSLALDEINVGLSQGNGLHSIVLARAYANRAAILLDMGRPDEALADLERAVDLDPDETGLQRSLYLLRAQLRVGRTPD